MNNSVKINLDSLERLIPQQRENSIYLSERRLVELHKQRYQIAANYVKDKRVLDIACGVGYGSQMLRLAGAKMVIGVDIAPEVITYAQQYYQMPGIEFICAPAEDYHSSELFEVIVSFETIEHLREPSKFLAHLHNLLVPGGYLLLSVPLGETRHIDPYHLQAFTETDIRLMLEEIGFVEDFTQIEPWFMPSREVLAMLKSNYILDDKIKLSWFQFLFTPRGWLILKDLTLKGGFNVPQLLLITKAVS